MASFILKKLRNRLSNPVGHLLISARFDDAYISAFPRSGSTWLRTILVNILDPSAKSNPDFFNARIPAVSIRNAKVINQLDSPRLIMTHANWSPSINKAVYLIRDGRDAFISSYHYHVTRNGLNVSIEDYYKQYQNRVYGHTWESNAISWLKVAAPIMKSQLLLIKFDDLKNDTTRVIQNVCTFLNIDTDEDSMQNAISLASLNNAKKIEQQRQGIIENNNASFYRQGESEQWVAEEYAEVIAMFENEASMALTLFKDLDSA